VRFRIVLALAWFVGVNAVFAFFRALGSTAGGSSLAHFLAAMRSDLLVAVPVALLVLGWALVRDRRAREEQGQPARAAWDAVNSSTELMLDAPLPHAFEAVLGAVRSVPKVRVVKAELPTGRIIGKVGVSWQSWGEQIRIYLAAVSDSQTRVSIESRPSFAPTIADYGKNQANVGAIVRALGPSIPVA
jgi:hypothetical protein